MRNQAMGLDGCLLQSHVGPMRNLSPIPMTYYAHKKATLPFRWRYDAIIDWRLANPDRPEKECAVAMGYSHATLSMIVNSDAFKARWEQRRRTTSDIIHNAIAEKTARAANLALDVTIEALEKKRGAIPFRELAEFTDKTLARLGYGVQPGGTAVQVNVNTNLPPAEVRSRLTTEELREAQARLRGAQVEKLPGSGSVPPPPPVRPDPVLGATLRERSDSIAEPDPERSESALESGGIEVVPDSRIEILEP